MGFGQFSVTSIRRTKAEQVEAARQQGYAVCNSHKAGHNRIVFGTADGRIHFMLHVTVIASHDPKAATLTLNDGGWPSITTRKAFSEAVTAFGLPDLRVGGGRPRASHVIGQRGANGSWWQADDTIAFDRNVTLDCSHSVYKLVAGCQPVAPPMIRAVVDGETSLEVTYRDGEVQSNNGDKFAVSPTRLIITLEDMLTVAAKSRNWFGMRHDPINYDHQLDIFKGAYHANGGRGGRHVYVGCHEFNTSDVRNILQRIKLDHPEAAKVAKAFIKGRKSSPIYTPEWRKQVAA